MTNYQDVSWSNDEVVSTLKLNRMANNTKHVKEKLPSLQYVAYDSPVKTEGIKIAAGVGFMPGAPGRTIAHFVYFGNYFTPGCKPVVNVTLSSPFIRDIWITIQGFGPQNPRPDHTGFAAFLERNHGIADPGYQWNMTLHWIAIGW